MGWSVSRHSEPGRKLDLFEKKVGTLGGLMKRGASPDRVATAAEKLRLAASAVIKAKRALIAEYSERDRDGRRAQNLDEDERH